MICNYCGTSNSQEAKFCRNCGRELRERMPVQKPSIETNKSSSYLLGVLMFIILLIIGCAIFAIFIMNTKEKAPTEHTEVVSSKNLNMSGYIGQYPVTMQIHISGSNVNGTYYYNRMGSDNKLIINGTYDNGEIHLVETTVSGMQTGDFRGRLVNGKFTGLYINYQGKEMAFNINSI